MGGGGERGREKVEREEVGERKVVREEKESEGSE